MYTVRLPKPSLDFSLVAVTFCLDSWSLAPCSLGISKCSGDSHRESLGCLSTVLFSPGAHPSAPPWTLARQPCFSSPLRALAIALGFACRPRSPGGRAERIGLTALCFLSLGDLVPSSPRCLGCSVLPSNSCSFCILSRF